MSNIENLIESEILLKMYYDKFIPLNCIIESENNEYFIKNILISETKLFKFVKDNDKFKIKVKDSIYDTDEWNELGVSQLTEVEKLMIVSLISGNNLMEDKIPSKVIDNIELKTKININIPEDITLTV